MRAEIYHNQLSATSMFRVRISASETEVQCSEFEADVDMFVYPAALISDDRDCDIAIVIL